MEELVSFPSLGDTWDSSLLVLYTRSVSYLCQILTWLRTCESLSVTGKPEFRMHLTLPPTSLKTLCQIRKFPESHRTLYHKHLDEMRPESQQDRNKVI